MDGIDRIIARINADAKAECDKIISEAAARAAEISADYEKKAADAYAETYAKAEADAHAHYERLANAAQSESKKRILKERQELVAEAMNRAVSLIRSKPDDEYAAILADLIDRAAVSGHEKLVFASDERERIGAKAASLANTLIAARGLEPNLEVSDVSSNISGGVIIISEDSEVNCDLRVLVSESRRDIETQTASALFS